MKVPIISLVESRIVCRTPEALKGKRFSIVSVGKCSFRCKYCLVGGYLPRTKKGYLRGVKEIDIETVEDFILKQVKKGSPIKFTGGEPSSLPRVITRLSKFVKDNGGFACIDTNGSNPKAIKEFLKCCDMISMDIKGTPRFLHKITGMSLKQTWYNPLEVLQFNAIKKKILEVKIPVFSFTTYEDILSIISYVPENGYIILRKIIPEKKVSKGFKMRSSYPEWFDVEGKKLLDFATRLVEEKEKFAGRVIVITSSGREDEGIFYF